MALSWQPRKVDSLKLGRFQATGRKEVGKFIQQWFTAVRGDGVVFERETVSEEAERAWQEVYGEPTLEEMRHAWKLVFKDRVNHNLRDGCGMAFPGRSWGKYVVRREYADEAVLTLTAAEKARGGHQTVEAAEHELRETLLARGLGVEYVTHLVEVFREAAGL